MLSVSTLTGAGRLVGVAHVLSATITNRLVPHDTCAVAVHSYEGASDGQMLVWWELRFLLSYNLRLPRMHSMAIYLSCKQCYVNF